MTAPTTALKDCCQRIVDTYMTLFDPPRENASLYCPECHSGIICRGGAWVEST